MKTSELTGKALNAAVALAQGWTLDLTSISPIWKHDKGMHFVVYYQPSTDWKQGGPIIEQAKIKLVYDNINSNWEAMIEDGERFNWTWAPTLLQAAMRCFCKCNLGDTVELPEGLKL